jgi:PAS domain S-box-containing protein
MKERRGAEGAGLAFAVLMLAGIAVLDYATTDALVETNRRIEHTRQVTEALDETLLSTTAAARFRRAYALTHDESEVERVNAAVGEAEAAFAHARSLTADDPQEKVRLDRIEPLLEQRIGEIRRTLAVTQSGGSDEAMEDSLSRQSNVAMREIARRIDEMRDVEKRLLHSQQEGASRRATLAKAVGVGGTGLSVAIILLVFARLRLEDRRRRGAQKVADRATAFLDSIVEHIPDMIFVKEADSLRFERINRAGEAMLGKKRDELVGKDDFAFFPPAQAEFFQAKDRETLAQGAVVDIVEEPIETPNGIRWLHTKKVPIMDRDGRPRYLLGISADITERKQTAAALRAAVDAAENANRELESFSYSVAHDLRAPLRSIDGFSQALVEDCGDRLDDCGREHLQRVRSAAQRMGDLIDSLLAIARIARTELRSEPVDLSGLAAMAVEELRTLSPGREVEVTIEPSLQSRGDPRLLRVVLDNLLGNAFKFTATRPHAHIEFASAGEGQEHAFFIRDDGVGFDPRYASQLFRVFQRLHSAREFPGTGIGLATVQRVIQRHGGRIWARGEPERGATFFFTLGDAP